MTWQTCKTQKWFSDQQSDLSCFVRNEQRTDWGICWRFLQTILSINLIRKSREFAFLTHIHIQNNAKTKQPWKNMQCWKVSRNEATRNSMIQGKLSWPIRAQNLSSHGSKGPPAGATNLGQGWHTHNFHLGPLISVTTEAQVGWS